MHAQPTSPLELRQVARDYYELTKPRIVLLTAFCALIGMLLASDSFVPWTVLIAGLAGISLLAGSGFAFNCLIERGIDARMARTRGRPLARGGCSPACSAAWARRSSTRSSIRSPCGSRWPPSSATP
jgi:protoheme IX farnesyltransferase